MNTDRADKRLVAPVEILCPLSETGLLLRVGLVLLLQRGDRLVSELLVRELPQVLDLEHILEDGKVIIDEPLPGHGAPALAGLRPHDNLGGAARLEEHWAEER